MPLGKASLLTANIQKPELWSDEDPALYTCEITLHHNGQEQKAIERFGFRHFEFVEKDHSASTVPAFCCAVHTATKTMRA